MLARFPTTIRAGLTFSADLVVPEYPAPEWEISAILRGPTPIDLTATGDGDIHTFEAAAALTTTWPAGAYAVSIRATRAAEVVEVEAGEIEILADLAAVSTTHDPRGHARLVLDAIEAVIENRATKDQQSYTIGGRSLQRTPLGDLLNLRAHYRREVARETKGRLKLVGRAVKVRFV